VNFLEFQQAVLHRASQRPSSGHRLQLVREVINQTIRDIINRQQDWEFMKQTAQILSEDGEGTYPLPENFGSIIGPQSVKVEDRWCQLFRIRDIERFQADENTVETLRRYRATIHTLTVAPFGTGGAVYCTFGSKNVVGVGTTFDTRYVGRYFKTKRNGQLYKVADVADSTHLSLQQEYTGPANAGLVTIPSEDLTIVYGNPHVTNWTEDMTGENIRLEGTTTVRKISAVDPLRQVITLTAVADQAGADLMYSIQDGYQVDPPGRYQLIITPTPTEDDLNISVDFNAIHTALTGNDDVPLIPETFSSVIIDGASYRYKRNDGWDRETYIDEKGDYENGIAHMLISEDAMGGGISDTIEPDTARLRKKRRYGTNV